MHEHSPLFGAEKSGVVVKHPFRSFPVRTAERAKKLSLLLEMHIASHVAGSAADGADIRVLDGRIEEGLVEYVL